MCLTGSPQHGHAHHLAHSGPPHLPFFHLADRHMQGESSLLVRVRRVQREWFPPRVVPIEPGRHVGSGRHAGTPHGHPVIVHGHARQPQRVAGLVVRLHFVQYDFERRPLVFLHRDVRPAVLGPHVVNSRQTGGRQGERGRECAHAVALHRLFGHGLPVRGAQFQRDLPSGHGLFLAAPFVRAQSAHIHRLSRAVDGAVGVDPFPRLRHVAFPVRR